MSGFVYILADTRRGRTHIGVTSDLQRLVYEHREGLVPGYAKKNTIKRLVYLGEHGEITDAIQRETSLKRWYRAWKEALIAQANPEWRDLWDEIGD
ncbi:GIY-YIG nuclease family protein [Devosia sp. MC1541]|uniref:GIY-YIG nuclease family protein n=1 Tax=Devosia sp. MC1541 TaxID=2725264 RepID=UPI00145CDF8E|nr:GIY-YIG nuclease family protein [Devosia sp. MC1541]